MSKKSTKTVKVAEIKVPHGMVVYTDGGARPNPGYCGWGAHGYIYTKEEPKKGNGHTTQKLTKTGYKPKAKPKGTEEDQTADQDDTPEVKEDPKIKEVEVINYWDVTGGLTYPATNNVAEIIAAHRSLMKAKELGVKEVIVIADSQLIVSCITGWLDNWERAGWKKSNGQPVSNPEYLKDFKQTIDELKASGCKVKADKIEAHQGLPGNTQADQYATIGVKEIAKRYPSLSDFMKTTRPATEEVAHFSMATLSPTQGYWNPVSDRHALLSLPGMVFWTNPAKVTRGEYYMCNQLKDEHMYGSKNADAAGGYVQLNTPIEELEELREWHIDRCYGNDSVVVAYVHKLYEPAYLRAQGLFGDKCIEKDPDSVSQVFIDGTTTGTRISSECKPWRQSVRLIEHVNELKGLLLSQQEGNTNAVTVTDITSTVFDTGEKGLVLKPFIVVGLSTIECVGKYRVSNDSQELRDIKVSLCMGVDMVMRPTLKKMEATNSQIFLLTWKESEKMVRWATVIRLADEGWGIWSAAHSNVMFVE